MDRPAVSEAALRVRDLHVEFHVAGAWHPAVRGVDLEVAPNETLAVVGESGSGKSVTALAVMGLIPQETGRVRAQSIRVDGRELHGLSQRELDRIRGDRVAMIFQEPMTALNPTMTVGDQIAEGIRAHRGMGREAARKEALRVLDLVKVPSAARRMDDYPHQFSGGMRQRVMIAMALGCQPKVLLADEPTTALDVTIQAQVLGLMDDLKREYGLSVVFITHNLGVVALIADRVAVMYAGEIVETATAEALFERPLHPYTEALMASTPRVDRDTDSLKPIAGQVPSIREIGSGCAFATRCPYAVERCRAEHPPLAPAAEGTVRCWLRAA